MARTPLRIRPVRLALVSLALLAGLVSPAMGHSFTTVLIVPGDTSDTVRSEMAAAFLLAADERDGHANEDSDGHLGGLDVYLVTAQADELADIVGAEPDIIAAPLPVEAELEEVSRSMGAAKVGPLDPKGSMASAYLQAAAGVEFAPFAERFLAEAGKSPGREAIATYLAARRIDAAVRELGAVGDRERLRALLSQ